MTTDGSPFAGRAPEVRGQGGRPWADGSGGVAGASGLGSDHPGRAGLPRDRAGRSRGRWISAPWCPAIAAL